MLVAMATPYLLFEHQEHDLYYIHAPLPLKGEEGGQVRDETIKGEDEVKRCGEGQERLCAKTFIIPSLINRLVIGAFAPLCQAWPLTNLIGIASQKDYQLINPVNVQVPGEGGAEMHGWTGHKYTDSTEWDQSFLEIPHHNILS